MIEEQYTPSKAFKRRPNGYVSFTAPGWLAINEQIRVFKPFVIKHLHGRLADIGCGIKPFKYLCAPYITEHIGIDHNEMFHDKLNVDIFAEAYNIPVQDGYFDCALSTNVLEHLEDPQQAFRETARILQSGGKFLLIIPFLWHLHEQPRDFYRYTRFGLQHLAEEAGFKTVAITPSGGFFLAVTQELAYMIYFSIRLKIARPVQIVLMNIFLILGWLLNKIDPTKNRLPQSYVCVFEKVK